MIHKIYIDLDSLLDTRIGTASKLDPEAAVKMLTDDYIHRLQDDFRCFSERYTKEAYSEAYTLRDVTTLKESRITNMGQYLFEMTADIEGHVVGGRGYEKSVVQLNIFPYDLSHEEQNALVETMGHFVGPLTEVSIIDLNPEQLYPMNLTSQYNVIIMYGFQDWLKHHHKAIVQFKNPSVTIVCPAIADIEKTLTKEDFIDDDGNKVDPFDASRILLLEFIGLRMLDSKYFSIAL